MAVILIAEDSADDYFLLERAFRRAGIEASMIRVRDGIEAQAYLSGEGEYHDRARYPLPDFALVDIKMPRLNGLEFLQWVRNQPGLRRIPIVMLTSSNEDRDIAVAYDLGANSYVTKPNSLADLTALTECLKNYWLQWNQKPSVSLQPPRPPLSARETHVSDR
jgi:CheY-like chemotaxis protein